MRTAVWLGAIAFLVTGGPAIGQEKKPDILTKLAEHRGGVSALTFNPSGTLVATGAGNGVGRLFETKNGNLLFRFDPMRQSGARVNHIGFSASGYLVSTSSRNAVVVWDISPPPPPKKEPVDPKKPMIPTIPMTETKPGPRTIPIIFEDTVGSDPLKIGTVTGDGRRVFYSATEGARVAVNSHVLYPQAGTDTADELKGVFTPWAITAINDPESELVAMYGSVRNADRSTEPAIALVGLGDGRIIGKGTVRTPIAGRNVSISFAPDKKWLVASNGDDLMYWRVPGSQVIAGDPKFLANASAFTVAAGANGLIAFASPPEDGKTVKVTIADISGTQPKIVAVYRSGIERVSALAFSPTEPILAVADDVEGVVQLWSLK
jgi:WD40 repeat protein